MRRLAYALALSVASGLGATSLAANAQSTPLPMSATPAAAPTPAGQRPLPMGASRADDRKRSSMPTCAVNDPMVWLDTRRHVYYRSSGDRPKASRHGHFACTSGALAVGAARAAGFPARTSSK